MLTRFNQSNYKSICDELALRDADLAMIITTYGYPPFWNRPNTFETLVHIILEQQVSLASALSALNKLKEFTGGLTPERLLLLTDEEMRACYCSRQKTTYLRHLAESIITGKINLTELEETPDDIVRAKLIALKGIGHWTIDIYLIFVLQHPDVFPIGDLAVVNALKRLKSLPASATKDELITIAEAWQPYRTLATMLLWHYYLSSPKKQQAIYPTP